MPVVKISQLKENPNNPRFIREDKFEKLVKSIQSFPEMLQVRPLVVNKEYEVLGGNMRLRALKAAKVKEVPVDVVDWSEEKQREFIIKDNASFGEWEQDMLANLYEPEDLIDWGLDIDFDIEVDEEPTDDNFEVVVPEETTIKLGDLITIGDHTLLCGDATNYDDYVKLTALQLCDAIITDPPYNVDYEGGTGLKIENDNMKDDEFLKFLSTSFSRANECLRPGAAWYVWHADSEGYNFRAAMKLADIQIRQCLIWVKNTLVMGRQDYQWKHEPCLYGWKKGTHNWYSDRKQTTVLEFDKPRANKEHPTMKPVELIAYLVQNSTTKENKVLDPFIGSGTTMVACHQLKRSCFGMELDPKYCQVVVERMLALEPGIEVKVNGKPYKPNTIKDEG